LTTSDITVAPTTREQV